MADITCPHCGTVFQVEESDYAELIRQVRDEELRRQVEERTQAIRAQAQAEADASLAKAHERIARLEAEVDKKRDAAELARATTTAELNERMTEKDVRIAQLEQDLFAQRASQEVDQKVALLASEAKIRELEQQVANLTSSFDAEKRLAVTTATAEAEKQLVALNGELKSASLERENAVSQVQQKMEEALKYRDQTIRDRDDEIERLRDQRVRLSTKMVGESLEQHCETEFNKWRATAFRDVDFHKDTDNVEGTKGDYVYMEKDESGMEILSIMFEMKNEEDGSVRRKRNVDHLSKLDKDRRNKGCEYAVLVSLLEPESDLYNQGIVDVSYEFEKMYVIRPQFFIPMITILRNAALNAGGRAGSLPRCVGRTSTSRTSRRRSMTSRPGSPTTTASRARSSRLPSTRSTRPSTTCRRSRRISSRPTGSSALQTRRQMRSPYVGSRTRTPP